MDGMATDVALGMDRDRAFVTAFVLTGVLPLRSTQFALIPATRRNRWHDFSLHLFFDALLSFTMPVSPVQIVHTQSDIV